jgi:superfamily II DNA/RNA helicase
MRSVFELRQEIVDDYRGFSSSFSKIKAEDIRRTVDAAYEEGRYWPDALIQINPHYKIECSVQKCVDEGSLHPDCAKIFRSDDGGVPKSLNLYTHQAQAISLARSDKSFIVTTGTGSGKSLSFFIPIVDRVLRNRDKGVEGKTAAIVIYPMNALANSQMEELQKYLPKEFRPVTFARYTGQENDEERKAIADNPPDILLTNYMMLELILTRYDGEGESARDRKIIDHCRDLEFLVLDELHTYRGRQGADVAMLVRRIRQRLGGPNLICIGTSATMKSRNRRDDVGVAPEDAASKLFGVKITPNEVVGETLERVTHELKNIEQIKGPLAGIVQSGAHPWTEPGYDYGRFYSDPMAVWVELTLGIDISKRPSERARPLTFKEAARKLALDTETSEEKAGDVLRGFLLSVQHLKTHQNKTPFAFKFHQFVSGPGRVSCTLGPEGERTVTLDEQVYAPSDGDERVPLFYTYFCRECGQEYHPVWRTDAGGAKFERREIDDVPGEEGGPAYGFIAPRKADQRYQGEESDLPDEWFDFKNGVYRLKPSYKKRVPQEVFVDKYGLIGPGGTPFWFMPGRFGYCVRCGTSHALRGRDINRLAGLSGEGRSSATSVLTLTAMRELQKGSGANQKLLGFIDNRQDAALQAGHFNDFMFHLLLRGGLLSALAAHGGTLPEQELPEAVFSALGFDLNEEKVNVEYMRAPQTLGKWHELAKIALCRVLGYRLLHDQRRGWRHNFPNLEQLKLIEVDYVDLKDFCANESIFNGYPETLGAFAPEIRESLFRLIFDSMRRQLCIDSLLLGRTELEKTKRESAEHLVWPWSLEDSEPTQSARVLTFTPIQFKGGNKRDADFVFMGPRSSLAREIKYASFWRDTEAGETVRGAKGEEVARLARDALEAAERYGYAHILQVDKGLAGYSLAPSRLEWKLAAAGAGKNGAQTAGETANRYFKALYGKIVEELNARNYGIFRLEAHEHTAQVEAADRKDRERRFRDGKRDREEWNKDHPGEPFLPLPVLYCSPTMELGVDISALDVVYMRNVPPTPANYAQRSGRAGRAGQAAFILTYCAAQSPHDQWYFQHNADIVQGIVKPPVIELANKDLVDSHLHAAWLSCVKYPLGVSIAPLMEMDAAGRPLKKELAERCRASETYEEAIRMMRGVEALLTDELKDAPWYSEGYAERIAAEAPAKFDRAFDRWRELLLATERQRDRAREIMDGYSSSAWEKRDAEARHKSAFDQIRLLTSEARSMTMASDFYIYRYLANQGFLPGYNFPRLPLMAWIPGGKSGRGTEREGHMVSRSRFLALSEFGPRNLLYHEGNTFRVTRAKLNAAGGAGTGADAGSRLGTISARICSHCGYCHPGETPLRPEPIQNVCEHCGAPLSDSGRIGDLYRVETVETERVERITANDEERQRQGFELQTTFSRAEGRAEELAEAIQGDELCASLSWHPSARVWRVNKGWRRRKNKNQMGFFINPITGRWSKEDNPEESGGAASAEEEAENRKPRTPPQRIVPYVEDHKNLVTLKPGRELSIEAFATVQAALEAGMERVFQIENSELAVEPLPNGDDRKVFLFYESAEGGAGVLQSLCKEKGALAAVARAALTVMHYAVPEGAFTRPLLKEEEPDKRRGCVAGCYSCLLSYYNQMEHKLIDRRNPEALDFLVALANSEVRPAAQWIKGESTGPETCEGSRGAQRALAEASELSPLSLMANLLQRSSGNPPDEWSKKIMGGAVTIDAFYKNARAAVFMSDPGGEARRYLESKGIRVVVFPNDESEWENTMKNCREIFFAEDLSDGGEEL